MMKIFQNLHTHTVFCDGKNSAEEMILSAVSHGLNSIGFSGHALTDHDRSYCMNEEKTFAYYDTLLKLREKYSDKIKVYIGLEQDYFSVKPLIPVEYLIGSVHYVLKNGEYIPVDETKEITLNAVERLYGGDIYGYLEDYFELVGNVFQKTGCDIVGHFDLPEKFNGDGKMFDRESPRYVKAYEKAMKKLVSESRIFEINTGGISRGYTNSPYPNETILKKLAAYGGKITVSSDSHDVGTIDYRLDEMSELAKNCGFGELYFFDGIKFKTLNLK